MSIKTRPLFWYELETVVLLKKLLISYATFYSEELQTPASEVREEFMLHGQITHGLEARGGARI